MKICMISSSKPQIGSGSGLIDYAYQLDKHIRPLLSSEDRMDKIYAFSSAQKNGMNGDIYKNNEFKKVVRELPKDKYDVVHITDNEIGFIARMLKESENRAKIVTTMHNLYWLRTHGRGAQSKKDKFLKQSIIDAVEYSDFLLCNSEQTHESVIENFGKRRNIEIVQHGIDDKFIKTSLKREKSKKHFTIGYVGSLVTFKNVIFILNAAKSLRGKDYRFILYGTGADMKMLQRFKEINSLDNLKLMGYLKEENKVKAYDSFDAFAFPSVYEGLGMPILEAKARGLPVILYKYGKIPKEVKKYCFGAESPEHMARIIENIKGKGANSARLKLAAKDVVNKFTWKNTAEKTLSVYMRLADKNKNKR